MQTLPLPVGSALIYIYILLKKFVKKWSINLTSPGKFTVEQLLWTISREVKLFSLMHLMSYSLFDADGLSVFRKHFYVLDKYIMIKVKSLVRLI